MWLFQRGLKVSLGYRSSHGTAFYISELAGRVGTGRRHYSKDFPMGPCFEAGFEWSYHGFIRIPNYGHGPCSGDLLILVWELLVLVLGHRAGPPSADTSLELRSLRVPVAGRPWKDKTLGGSHKIGGVVFGRCQNKLSGVCRFKLSRAAHAMRRFSAVRRLPLPP